MAKRVFQLGVLLILPIWIALNWCVQPAMALTEEQKLVVEAWRIINRVYLDETFNHQNWSQVRLKALHEPLLDQESTYKVIQQMVASLGDPFTRFLPPEQYRSLKVTTSGELTGVGLQIASNAKGELEVVAPIAGSPAEKAGMEPHDRILAIDGVPTAQLTLDQAAARMRGAVGSKVTLTVERNGKTLGEITLLRERIALNPVVAQLRSIPGRSVPFGYIRLTQFNANAATEVAHAIASLEKQGADAYILDLRSNPGGLLQAGIEIARMWLDTGTIVYTVNRQGIQGSFDAIGSALTQDPLIVLINQGTASASEILAGALQDNGRAQLVGETSFGKGLIQSLFDLSDGSGLAVTVAKYETPNHRDIHKQGITPDRQVSLTPITREQVATEADQQYQAAVELLANQAVLAGAP